MLPQAENALGAMNLGEWEQPPTRLFPGRKDIHILRYIWLFYFLHDLNSGILIFLKSACPSRTVILKKSKCSA
ncbi:MAG: hypothetical protein ACI8Z9_002472, partial [Paraglaciecola sp.]